MGNSFNQLLVILMLLVSQAVIAAQWGYVTHERAVIFADQEMTSPIGFVKKGEKVRIGEVPRNRGRVYPIIVNGRIAWIGEMHIQTNAKFAGLESAISRVRDNESDYRRFVKLNYSSGSKYWSSSYENSLFGSSDATFSGISAKTHYYKNLKSDFFLRVGGEYLTSKNTKNTVRSHLEVFSLHIDGVVKMLEGEKLFVNVYVGPDIIPYAMINVPKAFSSRGYGGGAHIGVDASYYMNKQYAFNLDVNFSYQYIYGMKVPAPVSKDFASDLIGMQVGFGFVYLY